MAAKIDESRASFLDLPPELRNRVYRDALTTNEHIQIWARDRIPWEHLHHYIRKAGSTRTESKLPSQTVLREFDAKRGYRLEVPILCSCKQILVEAGPVLYGANTFQFVSSSLLDFAQNIGNMKQHLRNVKLERFARQSLFIKALGLLGALPQIQQITIQQDCYFHFTKPTTMANAFIPLVLTLQERSIRHGDKDAMAKLKFEELSYIWSGVAHVPEAIRMITAAAVEMREKATASHPDSS